jgi:hypothetical protein
VQKNAYKILVLFFLFSSVFTIDGYEFLHNHDSDSGNHCPSCLLSVSLLAVDNNVSDGNEINIIPDFAIDISIISFHTEYCPKSVSDRAPPLS